MRLEPAKSGRSQSARIPVLYVSTNNNAAPDICNKSNVHPIGTGTKQSDEQTTDDRSDSYSDSVFLLGHDFWLFHDIESTDCYGVTY